jgi:cytochrome oxidase Cu insertion factor (SCO1/SenC/PrrC family)
MQFPIMDIRKTTLGHAAWSLTGNPGYTLDPTAGIFLFNRKVQLRGFSLYSQPTELLAADVKTLALEPWGSTLKLSQRQP